MEHIEDSEAEIERKKPLSRSVWSSGHSSSFTINVSKLLSTQHICQITRGTARETTGDLAPAGPPDRGPRAQLDAGTRPYHRAGQEAGPLA
jgi:hypothetical protein